MRVFRVLLTAALAVPLLAACGPSQVTAPRCSAAERLGLVAQSVPSSSYVPCVVDLRTGWSSENFVVQRGSTAFELVSDRAAGHAVRVDFARRCDVATATPFPPRTAGGRTYLRLRSIRPRYAGTMFDVFPGGCVSYAFDFARGPHVALMADLQAAVGFVSRVQLRQRLHDQLGVELGS